MEIRNEPLAMKKRGIVGQTERQKFEEELLESSDEISTAPIMDLLNYIIKRAIEKKASDIHFSDNKIMFRIDGFLYQTPFDPRDFDLENKSPNRLFFEIGNVIKVLAIKGKAQNRKPQEGVFFFYVPKYKENEIEAFSQTDAWKLISEGKKLKKGEDGKYYREEDLERLAENSEIWLRTSIIPGAKGESIVIRILNVQDSCLTLKELGHSEQVESLIPELLNNRVSENMILIVGPLGSGKTTTLYSLIRSITDSRQKIVTIEDPVEMMLEGAFQIPIQEYLGLDFYELFKRVLRHDANLILLGELRDLKTTEAALNASLSGTRILTTLHADNAAKAIERLLKMGIAPDKIYENVHCIIAQKLVRLVCPHCKETYDPPRDMLRKMFGNKKKIPDMAYYRESESGCDMCNGIGFAGRTAISEILFFNEKIRKMLEGGKSYRQVAAYAAKNGMLTMQQDAIKKLELGLTTPEELLRCIPF